MTDGFFELYAQDILALTREQFNDFRQADMIRMMGKTSSPPHGPTTPMTTLSQDTKVTVTSESQVALNNFNKGKKRDASGYPIYKNDLYYDTFPSWLLLPSKPKVFMMLLTTTNNNNLKVYYLSQGKHESSRIVSIGHILIDQYVWKV